MIEDRVEYKFLFTNYELINFLKKFELNLNKLFKNRYIKSLYMDTKDFGLYYRSKFDDLSKFKYRFRQYNNSSEIFEEIKYSDFNGKFKYKNKSEFNSFTDIQKKIYKGYYLVPKTYVSYDREYLSFNNQIRVTVDKNLKFKKYNSNMSKSIRDLNVVEFKKLSDNENSDFHNLFIKNPVKFSKYEHSIESLFL